MRLFFAVLALALVAPESIFAQPPAKKCHIDAMKAAMDKSFVDVRNDVKKVDEKIDRVLATQTEHGKKLDDILHGQLLLAKQIKEGFDGLNKEANEIEILAAKAVNGHGNGSSAPSTPSSQVVYVDRPVYIEKPTIVYVDRVVYKDRVIVQKEYVDRYVALVTPYRYVGYIPYYDCNSRFIGYYAP